MHELSLCQALLRSVAELAERQAFSRARVVKVVVGALSGVEPEALRFAFEVAARGTVADGARLELREEAGRARCGRCEVEVALVELVAPCPRCGERDLQPVAGTRLRLEELEVS